MQYPTPRTDYLAEKEKRKSMLDMDEEEKGTKAVRVLERKNKHCKRIDHSLHMLAYTYIHTYIHTPGTNIVANSLLILHMRTYQAPPHT